MSQSAVITPLPTSSFRNVIVSPDDKQVQQTTVAPERQPAQLFIPRLLIDDEPTAWNSQPYASTHLTDTTSSDDLQEIDQEQFKRSSPQKKRKRGVVYQRPPVYKNANEQITKAFGKKSLQNRYKWMNEYRDAPVSNAPANKKAVKQQEFRKALGLDPGMSIKDNLRHGHRRLAENHVMYKEFVGFL
jgi:hypothetical protein